VSMIGIEVVNLHVNLLLTLIFVKIL
jgi:hypothetical protein